MRNLLPVTLRKSNQCTAGTHSFSICAKLDIYALPGRRIGFLNTSWDLPMRTWVMSRATIVSVALGKRETTRMVLAMLVQMPEHGKSSRVLPDHVWFIFIPKLNYFLGNRLSAWIWTGWRISKCPAPGRKNWSAVASRSISCQNYLELFPDMYLLYIKLLNCLN